MCIAAGLQLVTAPAAVAFQALHLERRALVLQFFSTLVVVALVVLMVEPLRLEGVGLAMAFGSLFTLLLYSVFLWRWGRESQAGEREEIKAGS